MPGWVVVYAATSCSCPVRDVVSARYVQAGELRELGNMLQPRVRDVVTASQVQAGELR